MAAVDQPIKVGDSWEQTTVDRAGRRLKRVIEVVEKPTLSRPARVLIKRNDAHPHRKGKTTTIRASVLRQNYEEKA